MTEKTVAAQAEPETETKAEHKAEPKKYVVIKNFFDSEDNAKLYEKDNQFPKPANKKVSAERIKSLMNHPKGPFIKEV